MGRTPWAFADQALISGTNFFTMILLARQLSRREFGDFALVYAGLLLVNSLQAGPITTAHNVLGSTRRGRDYLDYTTSTAVAQLGFALAAGFLAVAAAIVAWSAGVSQEVVVLLALLAPAVFAWQLQEFSRRVLYTERRLAAAFCNDLISYGGQAAGIAALWASGTLSPSRVLVTLATSSALAAGFGAWQLRESLRGRFDRSFLRENWAFGKWLVGVNLVGSWLSNEVYFFLCGFLVNAASAGVLRASHTIFGPTRVLAYVLITLLPIHLSRTLSERGDRALDAALIKTFRYIIPLLGGYCLLVALCAGPVLRLFYRDTYADGRSVLVLYCILTFLIFVNMTIDAALLAKRLSPLIFSNQLCANLVILPFGWLAVRGFGPHGAVLSMIATNLVLSVLSWRIYRRSLDTAAEVAPGDTGADDPDPAPPRSPGGGSGGVTRIAMGRLKGTAGVPAFLRGWSRSHLRVEAPARRGRVVTRRLFRTSTALLVCWMGAHSLSLLGYALFSKGWAYVGVPPLFIGEFLLLCGVVVLVTCTPWWVTIEALPSWPLLALMLWGAVRTMPYLSVHGVDALRDAVIWGYGAYAFIVFGCIVAAPALLARLLGQYRRFIPIFLGVVPVVAIISMFMGSGIPRWPGTDTPLIYAKSGDVLVHLGAIAAVWSTGLGGTVTLPLAVLFTANVAMMGIQSRGGLLAFLAGFLLCVLDRPSAKPLRLILAVTICGFVILAATNFSIRVPGRERSISFEQFIENLASISSDSQAGDLDGTKQWRLNWWSTILNYTIHGDYFWGGKGFGINLADDDGFQVADDHSLRSPHNGHLTILARAGVPGLLLWGLTQLGWAYAVLRCYTQSRLSHHNDWSGLFLVLLAYWVGFMVNATFDVFIEGPMGGIWYWSIFGVGLAAMRIYRRNPTMPLRIEGCPRPVEYRVASH